MSNLSWVNEDGWTKLCLKSSRDINSVIPSDDEFVSVCSDEYMGAYIPPKLIVEYRNQSKIKNTGDYNISGYLYMSVDYDNVSNWTIDTVAINDSSSRTVNVSEQLALDLLFNGLVNVDDLNNGDGTYRVYAVFRDKYYEPLVCDDETVLESWYEFTVDTT